MESLRIRQKNIVTNRIKELRSFIKRNEDTIDRLRGGNITSFEINQIEKNVNSNKEFLNEIELLNIKIIDIANGLYDSELKKEMSDAAQNLKKNNEQDSKKQLDKNEKKKTDDRFIQKGFAINSRKNDLFNIEKETDKYFKLCDSIPDYIMKKLLDMPENKGYIWKGMWCFGKLRANPNEHLVMFEKLYNSDILRIYEIDENYRYTYEKKGKDRKYLVSKEPRSDAIKEYRRLNSKSFF